MFELFFIIGDISIVTVLVLESDDVKVMPVRNNIQNNHHTGSHQKPQPNFGQTSNANTIRVLVFKN